MENPGLLSEKRANPSTDNYVFVSYSHLDLELVYKDLIAFDKRHLNFWYDKELHVGSKWDEVVKCVLESENCKGVLLFMTPSSLMSAAVEKEIITYFEILKRNPKFQIIIISPYKKSVLETIRDIFLIQKDLTGKELEASFPLRRLNVISTYLTDNIIYVSPDENETHIDSVCKVFKDYKLPVFSDDESLLDKVKEKMGLQNIDGVLSIDFGNYPGKKANLDYPLKDGINVINNKTYYSEKRTHFEMDPIKWYVLSINGSKLRLASKLAIKCCKYENIKSYLDEFSEKAFNDNKCLIEKIEILNSKDLIEVQKFNPTGIKKTDYSSMNTPPFLADVFIIDDEAPYLINKDYKKLSVPVKNNTTVYILPVITIDVSELID